MIAVQAMYKGDSFFTLSVVGQIGLLCLTLSLAIAMIVVSRKLASRQHVALRIIVALGLFWSFLWLSPQVYYSYYLLLFDGLPLQNVISAPPIPSKVGQLLVFQDRSTLAEHGKGVLAWGMIVAAVWPSATNREPANH